MTFNEVKILIAETLGHHGKDATNRTFGHHSQWSVEQLNHDHMVLGECVDHKKLITINMGHPLNADKIILLDTIKHECAHALAGIQYGFGGRKILHGRIWRAWAIKLGATPRASHQVTLSEMHKQPLGKLAVVYINNMCCELVGLVNYLIKDLGRRQLTRRPETYMKLWQVERTWYEVYKDNIEKLMEKCLQ